MTSFARRLGSALFWTFFATYVFGVAIFLAAGLAPSLAKEFGSLHESLHAHADDALLANGEVTIEFENTHPEHAHQVVIFGNEGQPPVLETVSVGENARTAYTFFSPPTGSYRMASSDHPDIEGELRFAEDGARSMTIRVHSGTQPFERVGASWSSDVAHRIAEASHRADHGGRVSLEALFEHALNLGLGLLLIIRRPRDRTARLLAVAMIGTAALFNHQSHSTVRDYLIGDWWSAHDLFHLLSGVAYLYAVIVFPDGRLLPLDSRHRWLLRTAYGFATFVLALAVLSSTTEGHPGQPFFTVLFGLLIPLAGVASQTYRLRHAVDPIVRQQSRLLRWALLPMLLGAVAYLVLTRVFGTDSLEDLGVAVFPALFALVPIALIMGILRYRLWDIDVLVSRTLLSLGLAAFIGLVYVVVVVLLGHGLGRGESVGLKIVATAIAAVAFEPVRERLARWADRLVYGARATPYEVMAEFSSRLAGAISVEEILPRVAEDTVKGVGGVAGQATAVLSGGGTRTVEWPEPGLVASFPYVTPVTYRGSEVGQIAVATAHGERLRPKEEQLLTALAAQAGIAFNNARMTIELQARLQEISAQAEQLHASRQRIVTARQAQRQQVVQLIQNRVELRLERSSNMLDELEPLLASDVERALDHVDAISAECRDALDAMRELARGIFPAILADQGLAAALDAYVLRARLPVTVHINGAIVGKRYDPRAEAIVYFCVIQALANAGKYAPDSIVVVAILTEKGRLGFSVADSGPGTDADRLRAGADILDMHDRVEAVGGEFEARTARGTGTVIDGWVPIYALDT